MYLLSHAACCHARACTMTHTICDLPLSILCLAVFISTQALHNQSGQGKASYAVLPVVSCFPKAAQCGKLDAATLTQHELDSPGMDDSANERSDSGVFLSVHCWHTHNGLQALEG